MDKILFYVVAALGLAAVSLAAVRAYFIESTKPALGRPKNPEKGTIEYARLMKKKKAEARQAASDIDNEIEEILTIENGNEKKETDGGN